MKGEVEMKIDKETEEKIQEIQLAEQNMQNILMQKQAFQIEFNEINSSLEEITKSEGEIYKISSQIMFKSDKNSIIKELEDKKNILHLRIKSLENQEKVFNNKIEKLKKEIEGKIKKI